ncbi:MAG: helix-turn-helix transcriptional regulator [Patescibacteria group bacterium]
MVLDPKKLGQNIKKLRQVKKISQEMLARQADLKLSNLAKLEGGFNLNPTLTSLLAIAKVLSDGSIDKLLK